MATSPSLTIDSISNAIITDQGSSVSNGTISWSIAEQAEIKDAPAPTKSNYFTDTSGWSSRYYWSGKTGTTSFSGLNNTVTASIQVTVYTKTIVASKYDIAVGSYSSEEEAQAVCNAVPGSAKYYYNWTYQSSTNTYFVWRNDLDIDTTSSNVMVSKDVDVSNYITVRKTPTWSLSYGITTASASISNLNSGDSVVFTVYNGSGGAYVTSSSGTASGSSMNLSASGLSGGTYYYADVTVNGSSIGTKYFNTDVAPQPTWTLSYGVTSAASSISNLTSGDKVVFTVYKGSGGAYVTSTSGTASSSSMTLSVSGLSGGTYYYADVTVNGSSIGTKYFNTRTQPSCNATYNKNSITVTVSNLNVGDTADFYLRETSDTTGSLPSYKHYSYTRSSASDSSSCSWTETVVYDVSYLYSVYLKPDGIYLAQGVEFTIDSPLQPSYVISSKTYASVTTSVSNLTSGNSVKMTVYDAATGTEVGSTSKTATGSSMSLTVSGLVHGTNYRVIVYVNGSSIGEKPFATLTPSQTCSTSFGEKSITVTVSNLGVGDTAMLILRKSSDENMMVEEYLRETSSHAPSCSLTKEVEYDVWYTYSVRITYSNGENVFLVSGEEFIIEFPLQAAYSLTAKTTSSVTVEVVGVKSGSTVRLDVVSNTVQSVSGTAGSDNKVTLTVNNLDVGTAYTAMVYVSSAPIDNGLKFFTLFDWLLSTVQQGVMMGSYQQRPAPVTAQEWNRLVGLVNTMCNKAISTVSAGEEMVGGSGGNVRLVADALGVSVASGDRITAKFFLDLKNRINDML